MSLFRLLFNGAYRRARRAEGAGEYRRAAALYAEADAPEEASNALLFHAAKSSSLGERLEAWRDSLRWLPEGHPRRREVEARMGRAVLDDVQRDGVLGRRERQRLSEAAERLERVGRFAEAATAFELLGELDAAVRCLERGGEVERLERVYELLGRREDRARRLDRLLADYEAAMRVGARVDAETALREAAHESPDDATVSRLLRRLTARRPPDYRVSITVGAERLVIVGQLPARLGRVDADVTLRGASVSRQHAELVADGAGLGLRDLGSRNGTLVQGVPLTGTMRLDAETRVGLGEDVELSVEPQDGPRARVTVSRGVDRGLRFEVGQAPLPLLDLPVRVRFPEGRATLCPGPGSDLRLDGQRCVAPVTLLLGDRLEIAGQSVEVDDR